MATYYRTGQAAKALGVSDHGTVRTRPRGHERLDLDVRRSYSGAERTRSGPELAPIGAEARRGEHRNRHVVPLVERDARAHDGDVVVRIGLEPEVREVVVGEDLPDRDGVACLAGTYVVGLNLEHGIEVGRLDVAVPDFVDRLPARDPVEVLVEPGRVDGRPVGRHVVRAEIRQDAPPSNRTRRCTPAGTWPLRRAGTNLPPRPTPRPPPRSG